MTAADHAPLAPSAAPQWRYCRGSVQLQKLAGGKEEGQAAQEGTAAHHLLAEILNGVDPETLINKPAPNGHILTREQFKYISVFVDYVRKLQQQHPDAELWVEHTVSIDCVHPDCWGTMDLGVYVPSLKKVYILDLKYGYGVVEAVDNAQLKLYALGFVQELIQHRQRPVEDVVVGIVQPRAFHELGPVRTESFHKSALSPFLQEMREAAEEATGPNAKCVAGRHCRNCEAAAFCPALKDAADHALDFCSKPEPQNLTGYNLGLYLDILDHHYDLLKTRREALREQAEETIARGEPVPGYHLGLGRVTREWNRSDEEIRALGDLFGVKMTKEILLTPNQAENEGLPKDIVSAYQKKIPGKPKLKRGNAAELAERLFK